MSRSSFLDFKAVKAAISMEQLLQHYGLVDRFKKSGDGLSGPCPIHKGENPTQFRISISKNIWNCFSKCKRGGNVLDFISVMEAVSIHAAALKAMEWFSLDPDAMSGQSNGNAELPKEVRKQDSVPTEKPAPKKSESPPETNGPNKPLKFRLDKLEREHPYLITTRGLTLETIIDFGVGYCSKGMMAERIAIPIHNAAGEVLAYAGRFPGEPAEDTPKYKLPPGFRKSLELFNIHRAINEPSDKPLVIVEGFFDCMKLYQNGYRRVVALMGWNLSDAQEELIRKYTERNSRIILMLDEDEAGRLSRDDLATRLAKVAFVKIHVFEQENTQPDRLTAEEMQTLIGGLV